jgi:hypothetical protein
MDMANDMYKTKPSHFISHGKQCREKIVHPYAAMISCVRSSMLDILDSKPLTEAHIDHTASTIDHNYPAVLQSSLFFILQELHHSYITLATI